VPTYEYECADCKRVFEIRQRISEPPLQVCDRCGGSVRRLIAPAPFILKGGGWYVTDYPSESRKKAMKSESSSSTGAQSSTGDAGNSSSSGGASGDASKSTSNDGSGAASSGGSTDGGKGQSASPSKTSSKPPSKSPSKSKD
jgi:putative FmdB family regulatory protein